MIKFIRTLSAIQIPPLLYNGFGLCVVTQNTIHNTHGLSGNYF